MSAVADEIERPAERGRMLSLDVFRGLTIAGMVLVNNPGPSGSVYWPLDHAAWHGWTPTDLIFPFFLFIVGISITLALGRRAQSEGQRRDLYFKIARRTLIIFALGMLLAGFPFFNLSTIRIPGVLQRIAVCYFFTSLIFLKTGWRAQAAIMLSLLLCYWVLMTSVPIPGYGAPDLASKEWNLAAYLDRLVLGPHVWKSGKVYDPEGILSTIPAIATTLSGVLTGHWLRTNRAAFEKIAGMFVAGVVCIVAGWAWNAWFPINKALWTSSYVLLTTGMALETLASCYWLIDLKGYRRWSKPFEIFGVNALALFVLTGLMARSMMLWKLARPDGRQGNLINYIFDHLFVPLASPQMASLAYALAFLLLWLGLMTILYRKRIYIKV
ncbi:MAG TPA: heparan-alpha-glucosaminide N-acetyltransferase domain-containing protein [Pyrinomonadaceae bacterium]|jgi:predicted acyltransferase